VHPSPSAQQRHTCRVVVAAAGYGKTTALRGWFRADARWHRGGTAGTAVRDAPLRHADRLARTLAEDARDGARAIVVDDLPRLPADALRTLLSACAELPDTVSVALSSRWPLAPAAPRLGRGGWTEFGPADLALSEDQVADLLADEYGLADPELPERVRQATGGWPVLVHLAAETLRRDGVPHGSLLPVLCEPGGPVTSYLAEEVVPTLVPEALRLLRHVGDLAPVSAGLCRALGHRRAAETVRLLGRTGLLAGSMATGPGAQADVRVVPVVAEAVRRDRGGAQRAARSAAAAARWYDENGPPVAAARAFHRAGDRARCADVLDRHGDAMLAAGHARAVAELVSGLDDGLRTRRLRLLHGDALRAVGELVAAARLYEEVAAGEPERDAGLAWRMGRIHYQRGDARAALADYALGRGAPDAPADAALLATWTAHARLLAGDPAAALADARRAVSLALRPGGEPALGTAHLGVALCLGVLGDVAGSEEHYRQALPIAERTGDVVLLARIFTNRTHRLLLTARYPEALTGAERAVRYAAAAGLPNVRAIAMCNGADALAMLGRFGEAVRQYERAVARYHRIGSRRTAAVHLGLGEVYRRRGWREQARGAYENAIRDAEEAGNRHDLLPALAGLAMVLLADDPAAAAGHAERAAREAGQETVVPALLARGWVALHGGDRDAASALAGEVAGIARLQGERAALADALELRAAAQADPGRAREALREAYAIWTDAGAVVEAARVLVLLSRLPDADSDARLRGLLAAEELAAAGAVVATPVSAAHADRQDGAVSIKALGRFEVHLDGRPLPASRWQSRKARDLVRILVARRGRPVPREELSELLWPDDAPERTGHRLSVLLSIVRGVLDPDRSFPPDHYLVADQASIALDTSRVRVDVDDFLSYVAHARRLVDQDATGEARTLLLAVERRYSGDAFEDEPYARWCGPLRDQVRAAQVSLLRMLARTTRAASGPEAAVGYLLRLLEHDPYDEAAHRALVRALVAGGQHGEARRAFDRYGQAMRSIGVRPPDSVILVPTGARPRR
jgi:DNA-binding SARP family transcriptional activator/ATP/maltotriose-dependent transcriptional regulator MalT